MTTTPAFDAALSAFVIAAQAMIDSYYDAMRDFPENCREVLKVQRGRKYARIVKGSPVRDGGSAYCFIDMTTGDVLKPDGWKKPAKGIRGNIFTMTEVTESVGPHGALSFAR